MRMLMAALFIAAKQMYTNKKKDKLECRRTLHSTENEYSYSQTHESILELWWEMQKSVQCDITVQRSNPRKIKQYII